MNTRLACLFLCVFLFSCTGGSDDNTSSGDGKTQQPVDISHATPAPSGLRDWLTHDELNGVTVGKRAVYHNSYFMSVGEAQEALHTFNDTLNISSGTLSSFPSRFDDNSQANKFPAITLSVFTYGDYLVPVQRDILIPDGQNKQWRIIWSPGKVWSEPNDHGMSRASLPFVLVERSWNNTLNGIATFLFDENSVSSMRVQIVQHTSAGFIHEGAALLSMTRKNKAPNGLDELTLQFEQELEQLLPIRPWSDLASSFPDIDFEQFNDTLVATDISAAAIWYDNTLYMQTCHTKYGDYPYCQFMRHGIYSASKSATAAVALAFLAQRYGIEILDYKVVDYLDIEPNHDGWNEVTFLDLLNMAAGIGNNDLNATSNNYHADENTEPMGQWTRAKSANQKLTIATKGYGNLPWGPGEVFRYNTTHTFVLSGAMNGLTREREAADLWPLMLANVYKPLGISHLPKMHTTEDDNSSGLPIMGIGLYPTVDEAIKIARLLHNQGRHQGIQILHPEVTRNMLYRTSEAGFDAVHENNQYGTAKYHMSFWGTPYQQNSCFVRVPFMNGYGGNLIGILPSGVIVLRFTDASNYRTLSMIDVASKLGSICPN